MSAKRRRRAQMSKTHHASLVGLGLAVVGVPVGDGGSIRGVDAVDGLRTVAVGLDVVLGLSRIGSLVVCEREERSVEHLGKMSESRDEQMETPIQSTTSSPG